MKLKINKACDLSSISVLPPQSRRSNTVAAGLDSSSIYGRSQPAASQMRSQQPQMSQQSFSQGISSQFGLFSQFSQNSQEEALTNEKFGTQERENSVKRVSALPPPTSYTREENLVVSRPSGNLMRKWSDSEPKCQRSEELEYRIGMVENSLSRLGMVENSLSRIGMIMDSVQSDIMQVNKGTKEVALEIDGVRQKLIVHDGSLQLLNKGQEDIKSHIDLALKTLSDQLKQNKNHDNLREIFVMISSLPEKIEHQMMKIQNNLIKDFSKKLQDLTCSMKVTEHKQPTPSVHRPKDMTCSMKIIREKPSAPVPKDITCNMKITEQKQPTSVFRPKSPSCDIGTQEVQFPNKAKRQMKEVQKVDSRGWTSVKQGAASKNGTISTRNNQIKVKPNHLVPESRISIESDEEINCGFSCLLKEKGPDVDEYSLEEADKETARILRKARRRKRKYCNTIIID